MAAPTPQPIPEPLPDEFIQLARVLANIARETLEREAEAKKREEKP